MEKAVATDKIAPEFASEDYIESLTRLLWDTPSSNKHSFPNILRRLLPKQEQNILKIYYDGPDSLFEELSIVLSSLDIDDITESATRDLAIEITRFLICFPENYSISDSGKPAILKKLSANFIKIQDIAKKILASDTGLLGRKWEDNNDKIRKELFRISQAVHLNLNIIGETLLAISQAELTPDELSLITQPDDSQSEKSKEIYARLRKSVRTQKPVQLYMPPEKCRNHAGVVEYRFMASRGRSRNKGRVFLKENHLPGDDIEIAVPIATPHHNYSDEMLRMRLNWLEDSRISDASSKNQTSPS